MADLDRHLPTQGPGAAALSADPSHSSNTTMIQARPARHADGPGGTGAQHYLYLRPDPHKHRSLRPGGHGTERPSRAAFAAAEARAAEPGSARSSHRNCQGRRALLRRQGIATSRPRTDALAWHVTSPSSSTRSDASKTRDPSQVPPRCPARPGTRPPNPRRSKATRSPLARPSNSRPTWPL